MPASLLVLFYLSNFRGFFPFFRSCFHFYYPWLEKPYHSSLHLHLSVIFPVTAGQFILGKSCCSHSSESLSCNHDAGICSLRLRVRQEEPGLAGGDHRVQLWQFHISLLPVSAEGPLLCPAASASPLPAVPLSKAPMVIPISRCSFSPSPSCPPFLLSLIHPT